MILDRRRLAIFLMVLVTLIQGAYGGVQITASGGGNGGSGSVSMNYDTLKSTAVSSQIAINGATVTPSTAITGPIKKFEQTHAVKDKSGKSASVYVKVVNAPLGLTYSSTVLPKEGSLKTIEPWVSAEQWLTVPEADSIKCTAIASYKILSADVGIEETKSKSPGDYVTLTEYYGKAYASATQVNAYQTATDGSGNLIKIYNHAKDSIGTYSIDTILNSGLYLPPAAFQGLDASSSAGLSTQVIQNEHILGGFTSTAKAGKKTKTRTSNFGFEYDLNMQATKGSSPTGALGYYVNPSMATKSRGAILGAVNAAQSGDTINAAMGTYSEDVNINKDLTLKGTGDPTANSFTLNGILGTGSGGITAPLITVNTGSKIQDGVTLASSGGTVNVAAGTYMENVKIDKSLTVKGVGATQTFVDGNKAGSVFTIGSEADVTLSKMTITGGYAQSGGGIYNEGTLSLNDVSITDNTAYVDGGGIRNVYGTVEMNSGSISGNTAYWDGGGIKNVYGTVNMNSGSISGNTANSHGGGIMNYFGTVNMNGGSTKGNTAVYDGGGIDNYFGTVNMNGGSISGNDAKQGGGISNSGTVTMNVGSISGNAADNIGGGIYNWEKGIVNMDGGSIEGNTALHGGGINNGYGCTITMNSGSSILGNTATSSIVGGGGIFNSGTVTMNSGSSIIGNTAIHGGGITVLDGTVTMNGGSISGNTAVYGGGIYTERGAVTMNDGSIFGNTADNIGGGIYNLGAFTMNGGSISDNTAELGGGIYSEGTLLPELFDESRVYNNLLDDIYPPLLPCI
jgi:hypothetical protein